MSTRFYFILVLTVIIPLALIAGIVGFDHCTKFLLNHYSAGFDVFFAKITLWGEWPMIVVTLLFSVFLFRWKSWPFLLAFALEGMIIQGIKVYLNHPRPSLKFPELMRNIEGVDLAQWKAFPSGHTAAAFFGTGLLLYFLKQIQTPKYVSVIVVFLAFAVGYSRIYLGQHSLEDVLSGAFLGSLFSYVFLHYYDRSNAAKIA